jgi:hypothetical protein
VERVVLSARARLAIAAAAAATFGVACTLLNPLGYLSEGPADAGVGLIDSGPDVDAGVDAPAAAPEVLVPGLRQPTYLAQDATTLYWLQFETRTISAIAKSGGAKRDLPGAPGKITLTFSVDPDPAGFVSFVAGDEVFRVRKDGASPAERFSSGIPKPARVLADDAFVYVSHSGDDEVCTNTNGVFFRAAPDGGGRVLLPDAGCPVSVALDKTYVTIVDADGTARSFPRAFDVDAGTAIAFPKPNELITPDPETAFLSDDQAVYYPVAAAFAVDRVVRAAIAVPQDIYLDEGNAVKPNAIALDGNDLYFTDGAGNGLYKLPKVGGAKPTVLTNALRGPTSLVVDGAAVYVTQIGNGGADGALVRIKK